MRSLCTLVGFLCTAGVLSQLTISPGFAHEADDQSEQPLGTPASAGVSAVEVTLLDQTLVDQNGDPVLFKSEAVGDRIVVMDFVYTTCTTVCPVLTYVLTQVQDQLASDLKPEVRFISITVDPARDTPKRLREHARKLGIGPDWLWLTGQKRSVDKVLKGLDAFTPDFIDHPTMVLVGDAENGGWTRFFGFPSPDQISARVEELAAARRLSKTSLKTGE